MNMVRVIRNNHNDQIKFSSLPYYIKNGEVTQVFFPTKAKMSLSAKKAMKLADIIESKNMISVGRLGEKLILEPLNEAGKILLASLFE